MPPTSLSSPGASASSSTAAESLRNSRILASKLYLDVPASKVPLVYSSSYNIAFFGIEKLFKLLPVNGVNDFDIVDLLAVCCVQLVLFEMLAMNDLKDLKDASVVEGCKRTILHPFDSSKWGRICQFLVKEGYLVMNKTVEPLEASEEDLLVVHSETYLSSLKSSLTVATITELAPVAMLPNCILQKKVLHPFRMQVGGSIVAAKLAKERGWAINIGGGFHHCSAEKGGGFCAYADISLCIHFAFVRLNITRVMIIDLDAHQGNGHEIDFSNDSVFLPLSICSSA
ncbi:hypothetical protein ZIOFF_055779 [Zingiber officinale]|uniref:Histone deacetylase domain-containing protein n=1 Tax=Zingiber officinale TaxID=94328 RepID=A0A8J5FX07_ZINOF|nr:hypothetical protein ZIOFF_055779 [Zingiber officinale]